MSRPTPKAPTRDDYRSSGLLYRRATLATATIFPSPNPPVKWNARTTRTQLNDLAEIIYRLCWPKLRANSPRNFLWTTRFAVHRVEVMKRDGRQYFLHFVQNQFRETLNFKATRIRLWIASLCSVTLLEYTLLMPALYPPVILHWGPRLFISLVSATAVIALTPILRHGTARERKWALGILAIPILATVAVLLLESSYYGWFD